MYISLTTLASAVLAYATSCRMGDGRAPPGTTAARTSLLAIIGAVTAISAALTLAMP